MSLLAIAHRLSLVSVYFGTLRPIYTHDINRAKMPTMWLSDTQKIGVAFCSGGGLFLIGGVMMFFDRAMLAMGNILFLIGLTLIIGTTKTIAFFARSKQWKGTLAFTVGIGLILMRWAFIGFVIELYGILVLFGDFFATIAGFARAIPVVGPYIARGLEALGGAAQSGNVPV